MKLLDESYSLNIIMKRLVEIAKLSTCKRSKCGSIVMSEYGHVLGEGFNSKPCNEGGECFKDTLPAGFKSDKTCCVHAEQRAIMEALKHHHNEYIHGSTIYFIRLNENDEPKHSGEPYCSICSKMALDAGVENFVLWKKEGWTSYSTTEYNELTFQFNSK